MREMEELTAEIRSHYRSYVFAQDTRKSMDLRLGAFLRVQLGWSKDLPEKERNIIAKRAKVLMDKPEESGRYEPIIQAACAARAPFDAVEADNERAMKNLAKELPVWPWAEEVRGLGEKSVAVIVAEAGDLSNYATVAKLWKRFGVAVMDGTRQGGLRKSAKAEEWILHGYSRSRRSSLWQIGDTFIKAQVRKVKNDDGEDTGERISLGEYGQVYLDRKAYERNKAIAEEVERSDMHIHRRAQRYMEKRLLKHLWQAWREASKGLLSTSTMPSADIAA